MQRLGYDFDLQQLKTFLTIAETHNFTEAGARVGRTQAAVSLQVQRLEALVGKPLLTRTSKRVELTPEGTLLATYAKRLLQLSQELKSQFEEMEMAGEVRLGTPEDFATHYLPRVLAEFARSHPRTQLSVGCDLTVNLQAAFARGEYDMVLIKREPSGHKRGTTVWHEQLVWVAADAAVAQSPVLPLVLAPAPCLYRKRALACLDKVHRPWRIAYTSPSAAGSLAAVHAGLGVTVMPKNMVPPSLSILKKRHALPALPDAEIALLHQPNLSRPARMLADHIVSNIA